MKKKLTLSLEKRVIEHAKVYAKQENTSVSSLVENYLRAITTSKKSESELSKVTDPTVDYKTENTPLVTKMRGIMGDDKLTGNERLEFLIKKYG